TGDLNGDGHPDIVTASIAVSAVSVLLNNGAGTFGTTTTYAEVARAGYRSLSIVIAAFTGYDHPDIATANCTAGSISVLLNNGNSGITAGVSSTSTVAVLFNNADGTFGTASSYTVGNGPLAVALGDFNGDGHPDIVTPSFNDNTVSVLLNNGDGTFASTVTYP